MPVLDEVVHKDVFNCAQVTCAGTRDCLVLRGAEGLLRNYRVDYVRFELWPMLMERRGCSALHLLQFLDRLGCRCYDETTHKEGESISTAFEQYLAN